MADPRKLTYDGPLYSPMHGKTWEVGAVVDGATVRSIESAGGGSVWSVWDTDGFLMAEIPKASARVEY